MKKFLSTILLLSLAFTACRKDESPSGGIDFFNTDEKNEAAKIVEDANGDLKKVKTIYKENQSRIEEIKTAMQNKEVEKVKEIADDLVKQITEGIDTAKIAVKKIRQAEDMDINNTYKDYLRLKREALEKQIEAFELRQDVAIVVRDSFGSKDVAKIEQAQALFRDKNVQFKKLMDEAKDLSLEAKDIYIESLKQK